MELDGLTRCRSSCSYALDELSEHYLVRDNRLAIIIITTAVMIIIFLVVVVVVVVMIIITIIIMSASN